MYSIFLLYICTIVVSCHAESILFDCGSGSATATISVMQLNKSKQINDTSYSIHFDLLNELINKCEQFYDFEYYSYEKFKDMNSTIAAFSEVGTYINLFIQDYNIYASEKFNSKYGIIHAGDVYAGKHIDVLLHDFNNFTKLDSSCEILHNSSDSCNPNHTYSKGNPCKNLALNKTEAHTTCKWYNMDSRDRDQTAENIFTYVRGSKIMSEALTEHFPDLQDFVISLDFSGGKVKSREACLSKPEKATDLNIVLLCFSDLNYFSKPYSRNLRFVLASIDECENMILSYKDILLAVLAPAPFETDVVSIPTIFYKTPLMNPEYYSSFPNSFNLVSGKFLPLAFIRFIKEFGWRRVAIISDDTPYSHEFEQELLKLFNKEGIIYNVQRCEMKCNFAKAIETLKDMDAKIIVANVNERNAEIIAKEANIHPFTMLYRVHAPHAKRNSISITLGPANLDYGSCDNNIMRSNNVPDYTAILNGVNVIIHAHNAIVDRLDSITSKHLSEKMFYRLFKDEAMRHNVNRGFKAYVTKISISYGYSMEILWTMEMDFFGTIININKFSEPFKNIPVAEMPCYTKTNNFAKPCDISLSLLFMFVVIAFCITILIISCYFDNTSPIHGGRYRQL